MYNPSSERPLNAVPSHLQEAEAPLTDELLAARDEIELLKEQIECWQNLVESQNQELQFKEQELQETQQELNQTNKELAQALMSDSISLTEAVALAKVILASGKSAPECLAELLTKIYVSESVIEELEQHSKLKSPQSENLEGASALTIANDRKKILLASFSKENEASSIFAKSREFHEYAKNISARNQELINRSTQTQEQFYKLGNQFINLNANLSAFKDRCTELRAARNKAKTHRLESKVLSDAPSAADAVA